MCVTLPLLLVGMSVGLRTIATKRFLTVQVSSADDELEEGYFSLGDQATVTVTPGSDLYRFLASPARP